MPNAYAGADGSKVAPAMPFIKIGPHQQIPQFLGFKRGYDSLCLPDTPPVAFHRDGSMYETWSYWGSGYGPGAGAAVRISSNDSSHSTTEQKITLITLGWMAAVSNYRRDSQYTTQTKSSL